MPRVGPNERRARVLLVVLAFSFILVVIILTRNTCSQASISPLYASTDKSQPAVYTERPHDYVQSAPSLQADCSYDNYVYPSWPEGFEVNIEAAFILGEQKSGSTWLWELIDAHPCVISPATPFSLTGAITTKETYYFTSLKISSDARQFLIPWLAFNSSYSKTDAAWQSIDKDWFQQALKVAKAAGSAYSDLQFLRKRSFTRPGGKLVMKECTKYYILEATPHNLNSPVVAKRMKGMFPNAKVMAILKEPVWRMQSAYNQFSAPFLNACNTSNPASWCPAYRYYQLKLPSFDENAEKEVNYIKSTGCQMYGPDQKSWMECFGCGTMDPWRHQSDNIHIGLPPYVPSAALGMYAPMLKAWGEYFPVDDMRVINYQDLVDDPLTIVNSLLRYMGVEEYTSEHMNILKPKRLGFKGRGVWPLPDATSQLLQDFFDPLNQELNELLANHPIPWHPFNSSITLS